MVEALVMVPLVMIPVVDQKVGKVAYVVEALVMVPLVDQKLVKVPFVVEALLKRELPETVSAPPKYTLPVEWTERREPGVVVPMPTFPFSSILILSLELVAKMIGLAPVVEAVKEPEFQRSGVLTEVEKALLFTQISLATVR